MNIIDYETSGGKNLIKEYLDEMEIIDRTIGYTIRDKIHRDGLAAFNGFDKRQLRKKLWEIKFGASRMMYIIGDCNNVYFVHICKKQKNKTEQSELNKAIARVRELEKELGMRFL